MVQSDYSSFRVRREKSWDTRISPSGSFDSSLIFNLWSSDRTTAVGVMIDDYLKGTRDIDDHVIHLLFSANQWELAYVSWQ